VREAAKSPRNVNLSSIQCKVVHGTKMPKGPEQIFSSLGEKRVGGKEG